MSFPKLKHLLAPAEIKLLHSGRTIHLTGGPSGPNGIFTSSESKASGRSAIRDSAVQLGP